MNPLPKRTVLQTNFSFPGQKSLYHGKVRDVYQVDDLLIMVASDRISAFDHVLPKPIPAKGQVLNQTAAYFLQATKDICPNWLIATPDPNVAIGVSCQPYKIEMVVRAYLTGHAWRVYKNGGRILCGVPLPGGMKEHDRFPNPIITPATKAEEGHDEDISREAIIKTGLVPEKEYEQIEKYARSLFQRGSEMAKAQGLILVDTKYEFGKKDGEIYLIDEIHTPDSSRYFYAEGYEERQSMGEQQKQLSKEFVREWLMSYGFQGRNGELMPFMPDSFVDEVSKRYIELYEKVTGKKFRNLSGPDMTERIEKNILNYLKKR